MGIKNLWQLLSPVGRSVSIETLSGKTLAVDASIWLTQFIKAMRDDDGKVLKNAHIIGTLRRVVKLLYHRIRPVFVFDGGAPALKGRTLAARRKLRTEGSDATVRKTAQRILASQLKKHKAALNAATREAKEKRGSPVSESTFNPVYQNSDGPKAAAASGVRDTTQDDIETALDDNTTEELEGREKDGVTSRASQQTPSASGKATDADVSGSDKDDYSDEDDDIVWEDGGGGDRGGALAAGRRAVVVDSDGDEVWDDGTIREARATGAAGVAQVRKGGAGEADVDGSSEDGESGGAEGWEEVDLPDKDEDLDPEVLASLPGHVKKQVIEAAKRRQRMRSRAQYMPVAGDPAMYSHTQLSNFLRGQKLNAQASRILLTHKKEDGGGDGKRIASEAGRRYIMIPADRNTVNGAGVVGKDPPMAMPGAAAGSYGSVNAGGSPSCHPAGVDKRRRRITDEGNAFEEWSYKGPTPRSPTDNKNDTLEGASTDKVKGADRVMSKSVEKVVGRKRRVIVDKEGEEEEEEDEESDEDDEEEDGGFLPASDDEIRETPAVSTRSGNSITEKGKGNSKGKSPGNESKDWSEDWSDGEGGGFLVAANIEKEASVNTTGQASGLAPGASGKGKGKGKGKAREEEEAGDQREDDPLAADSSENDEAMGGNGKKRVHRRLQRTARGSDMDDDDDINENNSANRPRQPSAAGLPWSQGSVVDMTAASEAVARKLQDEEDERAAVSLQRGGSATVGSASSGKNVGVSSSLGPLIGATSAATEIGDENSVFRSAEAGHANIGTGLSTQAACETEGDGGAGIELEIDLRDLDAGGGGGERSALMQLLSSAHAKAQGTTMKGAGTSRDGQDVRGSDYDRDEAYDGFEDELGKEGEEEEDLVQDPAVSATNEAAFQRSVDMASRMAGWAGRVVERVLKEHRQAGAPPPSYSSQTNRTLSRQPRTSDSGAGPGGVLDRRRSNSGASAIRAAGTTSFSPKPESGRRSGSSGGGTGAGLSSSFDEPEQKSASNPEHEGTQGAEPDQTVGAVSVGRDDSLSRPEEAVSLSPESLVPSPTASAVDEENTKRTEEGQGRAQEESIAAELVPDADDSSRIAAPGGKDSEAQADASVDGELHGDIPVRKNQHATDDGSTWTTDDDVIMREDATISTSAAAAVPSVALSAKNGDAVARDSAAKEQNDVSDDAGGAGTAMFQPADPAESAPRYSEDLDIRLGRANTSGAVGGLVTSNQAGQGNDEGHAEGDGGWGDMAYLGDMDEEELEAESEKLQRESHRAQRDAETITDEMKEEVMDLLGLFGVPFVVAPMEAEAQCCELERLRLVDGVVTDDSDAFAFGGKTVYKNIFNDRKFVEAYLLPDAEKDLGVGTDEVVALALLLGSDYTEGVKGVGIVNAMEIINAFPLEGKGPQHGLAKFKKWIDGFDPLLDQELEDLVKNGSKSELDKLSSETRFHLKHRSARNRWTVSEGFPSQEVINAYKNPQVDHSEERFSWAPPDVDGLRGLCQRVLGWGREQSDGVLMPMVKVLDQGSFSQPRIDSYFMSYHDNKRVAAIRSKRLRAAVEDLAGVPSEVLTVNHRGETTVAPKRKKSKTGEATSASQNATASRNKNSAEDAAKKRSAAAAVRERSGVGSSAKQTNSTKLTKKVEASKSAKSISTNFASVVEDPKNSAPASVPERRRSQRRVAAPSTTALPTRTVGRGGFVDVHSESGGEECGARGSEDDGDFEVSGSSSDDDDGETGDSRRTGTRRRTRKGR